MTFLMNVDNSRYTMNTNDIHLRSEWLGKMRAAKMIS